MNGFLRSVLLLDQECFLHQNITVPAASPNQQRIILDSGSEAGMTNV